MMPRMSGLDVCRQLKAKRPSVPIIMLTARGQEVDKVVGLELGADDYVTKPFSIRELLARVKAVLRRAKTVPKDQERYSFGEVEVNLKSCQVSRSGEAMDFSSKEFELLKYFLCHPGETLSRDRLLEDVWGYDRFPTTRTVVLSGLEDEEYRSRAYALGVDLFWLKAEMQRNSKLFSECIESLLGQTDREGDTGFRGVQSKSLMDIIQMECLSRTSTVLRITHGPLEVKGAVAA